MIGTIQYIRKKIFDALNGNITYNSATIPVYNKVPTRTTYPFIKIYSESEETSFLNQSKFITSTITKIEVVDRTKGDAGGELIVNFIVTEILGIIKSNVNSKWDMSDITLSSGSLNAITNKINNINYLTTDLPTFSYQRAIIEVENVIEKI
jgi:hypothetical protein